jgi:hypothetical protein
MPEQEYLTVDHLSTKELRRIFGKIKVSSTTGCWIWTGATSEGYGHVWFRGRVEGVHRVLYAAMVQRLPCRQKTAVAELDHVVCNNPTCCNPSHLVLVPHKINVLRGQSPAAFHAKKTRCIRGHALPSSPNHVGSRASGRTYSQRVCKICEREDGPKKIAIALARRREKRKRSEPVQ